MRKMLALSIVLLMGCGGNGADEATPAPAASPAAMTAASPVAVHMVFEGLMAMHYIDVAKPDKGLWALMVDASQANGSTRPPCAHGSAVSYPDHKPGIFVENAKVTLTVNGTVTDITSDPYVEIEDENVEMAADPALPFISTPASLAKLVDGTELFITTGDNTSGKIDVEAKYLNGDPYTVSQWENLAGRVRIDTGVAAARANVCAKAEDEVVLFSFKHIDKPDESACVPTSPQFPVELGEDLLVIHPRAQSITLTMKMKNQQGTARVRQVFIEPDGSGKSIRINFRNVMAGMERTRGDICMATPQPNHYQWLYALTSASSPACKWVPCIDPRQATTGGGKCPTPGPGG